jgi:hypothetical protein
MSMMHVDIARAPQSDPEPPVMAEPAVGVAESLGALEDGAGVHIDEIRRQVLGQALEPLPLVGDEDRHHELIYPIGDCFGTTAEWHGGSFAETDGAGQAGRVAQM